MFASIFNRITEAFVVDPSTVESHEELRYYYGDKRPNAVLSGEDRNIPLTSSTATYMGSSTESDAKLNRKKSALIDKSLLPTNALTNDLLSKYNSMCQAGGTDRFVHLSSLADNMNVNATYRCGWIYNNNNPEQGQAAYGTIEGPLFPSVQGQWMWNLRDAKKRLHKYRCSQITTCSDLSDSRYTGICGFCKTSRSGVPINGGGLAYPSEAGGMCGTSATVLSVDACPVPPPPPPPGTPAAERYVAAMGVCDTLPGGRIPRDCYITKAEQAGCSDSGALIMALKTGSEDNYLSNLLPSPAYSVYQQRASLSLNETFLKTGRMTASDALKDFRALSDNTLSAANAGLKAAAADLCHTKGSLDSYDFCTEILPSTPISQITLECLQKEFKRAGGQETGTLYPSNSTVATWNRLSTWKDAQNFIQDLYAQTISGNDRTQRNAANQFYGINLNYQCSDLGNIPNVEIFWFTADPDITNTTTTYATTFLGRRIRPQIPRLKGASGLTGSVSGNASFVYFTNLLHSSSVTANFRFIGDSGFIFSKNKPMSNVYNGTGVDATNSELSSLYSSYTNNESQTTTSTPWSFEATGPNIITGYYIGNGTNYDLQMMQTTDTSWKNIPANMLYLTQHPYAPMIKFAARPNYADYGCDYAFCDKRLGSHKMKFAIYNGNGPTLNSIPDVAVIQPPTYKLDESYMTFPLGAGVYSPCLLKMYSFMTMVFKIRFTTLPPLGKITAPITLWPSYPSFDFISIFLSGTGGDSATLGIGSSPNPFPTASAVSQYGVVSPAMSQDGPSIKIGETYLITLKPIRKDPVDIKSINSITVGAARVSELQTNPSALKESSPVVWPLNAWYGTQSLEDPDSPLGRFLLIKSDFAGWTNLSSSTFDLYSIEMYDYDLTGTNLQHAAKNDWPCAPKNIYT